MILRGEGDGTILKAVGKNKRPLIDERMIHRWCDAWRKSMGNGATLWGNEASRP